MKTLTHKVFTDLSFQFYSVYVVIVVLGVVISRQTLCQIREG